MKLKKSVRLLGLKPEMVLAIMVCESIYRKHGVEMVITSITDSKHSTFSRHYLGYAFDLRTHNIPSQVTRQDIFDDIKSSLTKDFLVLDEIDHFHIGFKARYGNA